MILGFDTATAATAVALRGGAGREFEARDDPAPGAHPGHATRLLELADGLLAQSGARWRDVERVVVGTGPGGFTGLRVGVATARGVALSLDVDAAGVSSLAALAAEAFAHGPWQHALAVIDARRGEVFTQLFERRGELPVPLDVPCAQQPHAVADASPGTVAVGDGAVRYAQELTRSGAALLPADSGLQVVRAAALCRLAAAGAVEGALPDYVRRPDAEAKVTAP
ncbi:MAG TPA: tRNA (adenosine(37)-N6)-threonylcarbamoyltransferase complex dimerization subunit type 1 TsaB [Solirubrobacteraceae bacterium]|nr:tRNA (adenosine(37)-N6)-threonylcarbamoyltransferase complex dimerization subunit type 1 TsaB [Solirubrobacteraceae bacterium]